MCSPHLKPFKRLYGFQEAVPYLFMATYYVLLAFIRRERGRWIAVVMMPKAERTVEAGGDRWLVRKSAHFGFGVAGQVGSVTSRADLAPIAELNCPMRPQAKTRWSFVHRIDQC